jgi:phosphoglycolate phosphatase
VLDGGEKLMAASGMALLFDLDGTLTDSRPGILASMRYALAALGLTPPPDEALSQFIGPPTQDAFRDLLGPSQIALQADAIRLYRERFTAEGMFDNSVYPGIREGLATLRVAGVRLWVATSKPRVYAERIIDHFGLGDFFVRVYGSELSGEFGNKGDLIAHLLKTENLASRDAWMIGDRMHDIVGAHRNEVRAAGVLWGYGSREELTHAGAETLFSSMQELVACFA